MKKQIMSGAFILLASVSFAQTEEFWGDIPILYDSYGHKISRDGSFSTGEAVSLESSWGRNNITKEVFLYEAASCGDGNNISKDHQVVGTDKLFMKAAFLLPDQDPELIPSLEKYSESFAHGISWEGTRLCGILANPNSSGDDQLDVDLQTMSYLPFYCDINPATGEVSEPVILPTPKKDFFGIVPQYCTATFISDDGKTILGQVIDNSGYFIYPIVYQEDNNGNWDYTLPSEKLFNPDKLDLPVWPKPEMRAPQAENFINNPELKALFLKMLEDNQNNPYDNPDPYRLLNPYTAGSDALMTKDEYDAYVEALIEYEKYEVEYQTKINEYYEQFSIFISKSPHFLQSSMAMNSVGTMIAQTQIITKLSGIQPVEYLIPMVFNLMDGSYKKLGDDFSELQITQILPDGTLIAVSPKPGPATPDLTPQHSYVCPPDGDSFILFEDYIKESNPDVYSWMQEFLFHKIPIGYNEEQDIIEKPMTVTGLVAVSDDFTTISAGVDAWEWVNDNEDGWVTYFITGMTPPSAGIKEIQSDFPSKGLYKVYNTSGVNILTTKEASEVEKLPKGIYIINGKKIIK